MRETKKKIEIQDKAITLFKERGYDQVTLNDICKAANVSKNTFYYYFKSKESLLKVVLREKRVSQEDLAELFLIESPYEQYCMLVRHHICYFKKCGKEIMKRILVEKLSTSYGEEEKEQRQGMLLLQETILRRAQEAGEIKSRVDPHILAKAGISLLIGLSQIWTTDEKVSFDLEEEFFDLLDALMQRGEE